MIFGLKGLYKEGARLVYSGALSVAPHNGVDADATNALRTKGSKPIANCAALERIEALLALPGATASNSSLERTVRGVGSGVWQCSHA